MFYKLRIKFIIMSVATVLVGCGKENSSNNTLSMTQQQKLANKCSSTDYYTYDEKYVKAKVDAYYADKIQGGFTITDIKLTMVGTPVGDAEKPIYLLHAKYTLSTGLVGEILEAGYIDEQCGHLSTVSKMGAL